MPQSSTPPTFVEVLLDRAATQPDRRAYTFLDRDGEQSATVTYAELDLRARTVAAHLQDAVKPGDRAVILHPFGLEYIAAFLGCLYAGVVAVPAYPPQAMRRLGRLTGIITDAQAAVALSTAAFRDKAVDRLGDMPQMRTLSWLTSEATADGARSWRETVPHRDDLAFLQYTSGSTTAPRGVMVSHSNLTTNAAQTRRSLGGDRDWCMVSWLPPFHDMGLIGGILQPLHVGYPAVLMEPGSFILRPVRWLQAISAHRATISLAPPFALDLCAERVDPVRDGPFDLSSLAVLTIGAEPIRPRTLDRFAATFAVAGFDPTSYRPAFGLAEATLTVSVGTGPARPTVRQVSGKALEAHTVAAPADDDDSVGLTGCGVSMDGQRIVIADPETGVACAPGVVGEIWVWGADLPTGYWNRPADSRNVFRARLAGGDGPFLRTGDLGFLDGGELFVTGRIKDLLIIRGRNIYPQDVELTVEGAHPALAPGSIAVAGFDVDGQDRVLIVAEVRRGHTSVEVGEVLPDVTGAVAVDFDVAVHALALVRPGSIPKTSSGKIQRAAARTAFLDGSLSLIDRWIDPHLAGALAGALAGSLSVRAT